MTHSDLDQPEENNSYFPLENWFQLPLKILSTGQGEPENTEAIPNGFARVHGPSRFRVNRYFKVYGIHLSKIEPQKCMLTRSPFRLQELPVIALSSLYVRDNIMVHCSCCGIDVAFWVFREIMPYNMPMSMKLDPLKWNWKESENYHRRQKCSGAHSRNEDEFELALCTFDQEMVTNAMMKYSGTVLAESMYSICNPGVYVTLWLYLAHLEMQLRQAHTVNIGLRWLSLVVVDETKKLSHPIFYESNRYDRKWETIWLRSLWLSLTKSRSAIFRFDKIGTFTCLQWTGLPVRLFDLFDDAL